MTDVSTQPAARLTLPAINADTIALILLSGAVGTMAFDIFGRALSPIMGFASLAPVGLARGFLGTLGLPNGAPYGHLMHLLLVGMIAYPVGWLFVARPAIERVLPSLPWILGATAYGVGLWIFAIGGIATFAGNPPFLNFTGITWVALVGHVLYALAAAATVVYLERLRGR
ncbi:MAG: hypothetical protein AAF965_08380 [Pseudomonadota bacterium]|mgnify:CR=1 FL=1